MTKIREAWPPNIAAIRRTFPHLSGREIFAWAGTIYNPGGGTLPPEIIAHEEVHFEQQGDDPQGWWKCYLSDVEFRLSQEVDAHRAEWQAYRRRVKNRDKRARFLARLSGRLSGPLYGNLINRKEAKRLIRS